MFMHRKLVHKILNRELSQRQFLSAYDKKTDTPLRIAASSAVLSEVCVLDANKACHKVFMVIRKGNLKVLCQLIYTAEAPIRHHCCL